MPAATVEFEYHVGLRRSPFTTATLVGAWDDEGRASPNAWTSRPMERRDAADGDTFVGEVAFHSSAAGASLGWGVVLERKDGEQLWAVMAEVPALDSFAQERRLTVLPAGVQRERHHLTRHRYLGARPAPGGAIRFAMHAPNATAVDVVFGGPSGYIADDGHGIDPSLPVLTLEAEDGLWTAMSANFADHVGRRYMYRVRRDDGRIVMRTDMYSLEQCGSGSHDPRGQHYDGASADLDGTPSCSVIVDAATVRCYPPGGREQTDADFWADEHDATRPTPRRLEDLVIYELHIGALRPETPSAGTFEDAIGLLPYLEHLGVNAVELLPLFEFSGTLSWGYGSSHFLAVETSAGGRDALKHFVKACHQRGIAVLMDVVYNHYTQLADRAAWKYDSDSDPRNWHYWYEGDPSQYGDPSHGYVQNVSSGSAPRYHDEHVRAMFVSSAALLIDEFHIDGLRVDQTTSIHAYNRLNYNDGPSVPAANVFGRKLLRELCQTLKAIDPGVMLIAEDHSGWHVVTEPSPTGGIGFDATWHSGFYHHLIGDKAETGPEYAKLLATAAQLHDGALAMRAFAQALQASAGRTVVYAESHDEAGNSTASRRTIVAAVDGAPLVGATRRTAESRVRFAAGMALLAPATPMIFMGEEVGAAKPFTYNRFAENKEDVFGLRDGTGAQLYRFHRELIALRRSAPGLRSRHVEILHANDSARVLAFRRWDADREYLVVASLAETAYDDPDYRIWHPSLRGRGWRECFNSDAADYGGDGVGNRGATLDCDGDMLPVVIPAMGIVVFERQA